MIGASDDGGSVGEELTEDVLGGGFAGPIYLVKSQVPAHRRTRASTPSTSCQRHQTSRSSPPPPDTVPGLIAALGKKGTRAAVVITGGLGLELRQRMLDAARPTCLRIVCPNCLGLWVPALRVNPNFRHGEAEAAQLAFLSQSGALVGGVLDWAESRGIRFSYVVSMGDMAVVDAGDLLDFLAADISTSAILPYRETIPSVRKFMSASRSAARAKPVVVIKSGRSEASARAAATDTGAFAGSDAAVVSAFRRAGLVRVEERDSRRRTSLPPSSPRARKSRTRPTPALRKSTMAAPWPSSLSARIKASCSAWRGLRRTQTFVSAEYAVIVRSDLKGAGLGRKLMQQLIRYVESEGLRDSLFFLLWS